MTMQMGMEDEVELIPPVATPPNEPIIPQLGRDEALHGGESEPEDTHVEVTPVVPPLPVRRSPLTTFKAAIAAAVGRHETKIIARDMFGRERVKTLHSQDVTELENKAFAELQLSETKDKWNIKDENLTRWQKFGKGVERFLDRMWRGTATENLHRVKEYKHGIKLSATAGIEGAISAEFNAEVDRLARKRIDEERQSWWQKTLGKGKDLFQETFALERDLHKYKVEATAKLRADFENNPLDTTNPLYHLVNRDIAAREEVARRLSDTPLEILQESNQKNTKVESIKLEGPAGKKVETFLKEQIFGKVIDDALSRSVDRTQPFRVSDKLRVNLDKTLNDYFFSDDFQEWRKTLTPEQQAAFENSFTYASTILTQAEEALIPAVLDNVEHYRSADRLNFDIELALGTTQYSANTEAKLENWGARKERASMNQEIWGQMRRQVKSQAESTYQFRADAVNRGLRRERILGAVDSIARNEMVAAATGVLVGKSVVTGLRAGLGWVPFIGGVVAGGASATKEWGRLNRMRAQYGFEEAVGLSHPQSENAKRSEQMRKVDYHRIELGRRVQQLSDMTEKLNTGSYTDADLLQALGYLADSKARVKLSDHYGINLLTASKDTPEGRAIYQREIRLHDLSRATATAKLKEIVDSNSSLGQSLGEKIGLLPGTVHQTDEILAILSQNLEVNLQYGTQIPTELQVALGSLTISEAESIEARDQAFNKLRWTSSAVRGVTTGVIAGLAATGLGHFFGSHSETIASTHNVVDLKVVDHTLPTHIDNLGGIGQVTNPITDESVTMHAHLPAGTHLVVDPIRVGGPDDMETAYNLVGADNEVLVRGMQFEPDGQLQMSIEVRDALAHNHIEYEATPLSPITWETASEASTTTEIDPSQWTHSLTYEQMGGSPDTFFNNNINQLRLDHPEYADVDNSTFINGLRYTLRGMENHIYNHSNVHINQIEGFPRDVHFRDSVWGQEFVIAPQADNAEITNLPDFIATAEGNERVMKLIHESIQQYNATQTFTDDVHRIAYEMSYGASDELKHIPDADEIKILVEYLGASSTPTPTTEEVVNTVVPHDAWFTATESITTPVEVPITETYTMSSVEWYNALIPTGFARPLEQSVIKSKNLANRYPEIYPRQEFANGSRLRDIIRAGNPADLDSSLSDRATQYYNSSYSRSSSVASQENKTEGQRIIERISEAAKNADRIYVTLGGPIGDAIVGANYVTALREALKIFGKNIPLTVIVSEHHKDLFEDMGNNINIEVANSGKLKEYVSNMIDTRLDKAPLVLDFGQYSANIPTLVQNMRNGKTITVVNDLLPPAIELYTNNTDGEARYTHFVEDILGMHNDSISPETSKFVLKLPQDHQQIYEDLSKKFSIDKSKEQIGIVVEASSDEKRYPLDQWLTMISKIAITKMDAEFSIIYNDKSSNSEFNQSTLTKALGKLPARLRNKIHLFSGNLIETAIVMSHQSTVISNDTGLAHISGHIENGPKVVTLHLSKFSPDMWVSNTKKQTAIVAQKDQPISSISVDEILTKIV